MQITQSKHRSKIFFQKTCNSYLSFDEECSIIKDFKKCIVIDNKRIKLDL